MPNPLPAPSRALSQRQVGLHPSTHLYLAVGMALLIGMLVASYMQASAGLDALKQFGISSLHAGHLDRLNLLLLDAQSATRGYALTEDPAYRTSFQASAKKIQ
ncbi:MAG: CHASE3 domain-containing protein, partial [Thiobacillus sp.]